MDFVGGKPFDPNKEDYRMKDKPKNEHFKSYRNDDHSKRREPQQRQRDYQAKSNRDRYSGVRDNQDYPEKREYRDHRNEYRASRDNRDRHDHRDPRDHRDHRSNRDHRSHRDSRGNREDDRDNRDRRDHRERRRSPVRSQRHGSDSPHRKIRRSRSPKISQRKAT